jgi:hypothetical protein
MKTRKIWFAENLVNPEESGFALYPSTAEAFVVGMLNDDGKFVQRKFRALVTRGKAKMARQIDVLPAVAAALIVQCEMLRRSEQVP